MVAAPLSCVLHHRFREARAGGGAVLRALAHVAAYKGGVQLHCGVEYHYYVDCRPSSTPNGAGAAENAGLEHKIKALGAPAPT